MIPVTKPFLPSIEEYNDFLKGIWKRNWLTNMGPLASDLEVKLKEYLMVKHLLYVSNGTIALQMAIKALDLKGEIITTPFSFVATTSSIVWEGCKPVFVDIEPQSLNIDPTKIEQAINEKTVAILATHVYGNPCDVMAIDSIAKKYHLKVIYDGAHAFGVKLNNESIFNFGNISICSLHATKLYHSIEGGLLITKESELVKKLAFMRNFGFNGPEAFAELGINGKNSEFHAAMGLVNLSHIQQIIGRRKDLSGYYSQKLKTTKGTFQRIESNVEYNYSYFPIVFETKALMIKCLELLNLHEIFPRRYFYPSLAKVLPYLKPTEMPVTESISNRVMCLPLFDELSFEEIDLICRIILRAQNN